MTADHHCFGAAGFKGNDWGGGLEILIGNFFQRQRMVYFCDLSMDLAIGRSNQTRSSATGSVFNTTFTPRSSFSLFPHLQHDSCCLAGAEGGDGFVDLVEGERVGDEPVETHFSKAHKVDEAGDFEIRRDAAAVGAFEDFFEVEGEGVDGDVVAFARDADENRAAVWVRKVVGEFDDARIAGGVDDDIGSGGAHNLANFSRKCLAFCRRVEGVGEAPLAGSGELCVDEIDANDRVGGNHLSGLRNVETNAADAKDQDALADFHLSVVVDHPHCRRHRAPEKRGEAEVEILRDYGETVFGDNRLVVEGSDPTGIDGFPVPIVFRRFALEACTLSPVENDVVARLDAFHSLSNRYNGSGTLMTEEVRKKPILSLGRFDFVELGTADPAVVDANVNLPEGKPVRHAEFGDFERSAGLGEDGGEHGSEE